MLNKALKQGLGLACVMAVLAGCSSTSTTDSAATSGAAGSADQGVATGTATGSDINAGQAGSANQDAMVALDTVFYFDFDQATLKPESRASLMAHAERLIAAPSAIRLEGHADERGTREYNMALGERRANAVRDFLVLQGVNRGNLEVISYGEERPAAMGSSDSSMAQNRRVELK